MLSLCSIFSQNVLYAEFMPEMHLERNVLLVDGPAKIRVAGLVLGSHRIVVMLP